MIVLDEQLLRFDLEVRIRNWLHHNFRTTDHSCLVNTDSKTIVRGTSPMPPITSFHGDYDFLSNFAYSPLRYEGESYPTVEHAFQAAKTFDPAERQKVREASSPGSAKRLGRRVTLRADWETVKYDIMLALLRQKFSAPDFRQKLLDTGDADLIEGNTWSDRTWGCVQVKGQWVGKNHLGKLLMQVRAELQAAVG